MIPQPKVDERMAEPMKASYAMFFAVLILAYSAINLYVGYRGWQALSAWLPNIGSCLYVALFLTISLSYPIGRLATGPFPGSFTTGLQIIGSYWMGALYYLLFTLIFIDLIRLLDWIFAFIPDNLKNTSLVGAIVTVSIGMLLFYGAWNARHPRVVTYDLEIPKAAGVIDSLNIVAVSDIHLGTIVHNGRLSKMVKTINSLHPDIVLLPGDIIDENIKPFIEQNMPNTFQKIESRYGLYAVLGNHEHIGGHVDVTVGHLEEASINVLRDRTILITDSFYIAGRDENWNPGNRGGTRAPLSELLHQTDRSKPIILMDHQPLHLDEAAEQGIDLQISGHTHLGQLFPNQFITRRIFEIDHGYLQKGSLQVIVSSGFGTWGPPIRVGNTPEIVQIKVKFTGPKLPTARLQ